MGEGGEDKVLRPLGDKPLWQWSLDAFVESGVMREIILVCLDAESMATILETARRRVGEGIRLSACTGGAERADSVLAGLAGLSPEIGWVAVHDGARPFIQPSTIGNLLTLARREGAAVLARPVTDTIKSVPSDRPVESANPLTDLDRRTLWAMETPQVFPLVPLREAYAEAIRKQAVLTDDAAAWSGAGGQVALLSNPFPNPKLTYPEDWAYLEFLLAQKEIRTKSQDGS